jgi:thiamine pyrophosphate-dependent acetolactate synthase large subunit-like protein
MGFRRRSTSSSQIVASLHYLPGKTEPLWLRETADPMMPQQLYCEIQTLLPADAIIILEGNINLSYGQFILEVRNPLSWFDPGWNGTIGCGLPLALGAKLACPERPVVAVVGDTGFGMCGMDFETAVRLGISVILIIANNNGITGNLRQTALFSADSSNMFAQFLPDIRYDEIANAFGGYSAWITRPEQLSHAFSSALRSRLPACLNVCVNPNAQHCGVW